MRFASFLGPAATLALAASGACAVACSGRVESNAGGAVANVPDVDVNPGLADAPLDCSGLRPAGAESRLLTRLQYDNTVRDLLGTQLGLAGSFPKENTLLGFSNNASTHRVSLLLAEGHLEAAERLARERVEQGLQQFTGCQQETRDCALRFIQRFGLRAYRRPLLAGEQDSLVSLFDTASASWGFQTAIELVLQTFLQSPHFLYRHEGLGVAGDAEGGSPLDGYTVASRLSYFLWNTMPDDELFDLAAAGSLAEALNVEQQARRMLADPRAQQTVQDFYSQWLGLDRFDGLAREIPGGGGPGSLNASWRQSLLDFAQHTFWGAEGGVDALLSSRSVFLSPQLVPLYGVGTDASAGQPVDNAARGGLLSQPGLMALLAHPDQSAPVQRGVFVRERLLCQSLPPPPPDADTSPPDPSPDATTRERFAVHSQDASCAKCHRMIDPIGFAFEGFDHLGRVRSVENGEPIDVSGEILAAEEESLAGPFEGVAELSEKLAASQQVYDCISTQWYRYAMGRAEQAEDLCSLERAQLALAQSGGSFEEMLVALATSDAFRFKSEGSDAP